MKYVEYVEAQANAEQYINTDVAANNVSKIEINFAKTQTPVDWSCIIGACEDITTGDYSIQCTWHTSKFMAYTGLIGIQSNITDNNYHTHVIDISGNSVTYTVDGIQQGTSNKGNTGSYALWIFRNNHNWTGQYTRPMPARVTYCKIWDSNGTLIRDYVAAIDNNDIAGLYDKVNNTFYRSAGNTELVAGPVITGSYTIHFEPNGGSGSMPDQSVMVDEYTFLDPCSFTRAGYEFAGWAESAGGPVVYTDGNAIYNIAQEDETVTLYAVWERPTLKCTLQYNKSENNKAVKDLETIREFTFKLKDPTSIIDPVLLINGDILDMLNANYLTITLFGRSYFINNITSIANNLVEISAHVDVLSSYLNYIKECEAIVHRQENKWNLFLDDGIFKTYQNPRIGVAKFPSGFTTQNFVLAVAGD